MQADGIAPNVVTYRPLSLNPRGTKCALYWFERMEADGIAPNVVTYNTLIAQSPGTEDAHAWFDRMQANGIAPDHSSTPDSTLIAQSPASKRTRLV